MNPLAERLRNFAGRVVMGAPIRQPAPPPVKDDNPAPDAGQATATARAFAARLRELAAARAAMDAAVNAERAAASFDLAGAVARGEPLPDPEGLAEARSRAALRLQALWQLANREAEGAAVAVHLLRSSALTQATAAREDGLRWLMDELPPVFDDPEAVARMARLTKEADRAIQAIHKAPQIPLRNAPLFGKQLHRFRIEPLPAGRSGLVLPPDELQPENLAADIETTLALLASSVRFHMAILTAPATARWQG